MSHQFTFDDSHSYHADEVLALVQKFYVKGKEKGRIEGRFTNYRWLAAGLLIGAGWVLLYQVIA